MRAVFSILLHWSERRDWQQAFLSVIPSRKQPTAKQLAQTGAGGAPWGAQPESCPSSDAQHSSFPSRPPSTVEGGGAGTAGEAAGRLDEDSPGHRCCSRKENRPADENCCTEENNPADRNCSREECSSAEESSCKEEKSARAEERPDCFHDTHRSAQPDTPAEASSAAASS